MWCAPVLHSHLCVRPAAGSFRDQHPMGPPECHPNAQQLTPLACCMCRCACPVLQIMSANAYFLVYRLCPGGAQQQPAQAPAEAAAPRQAAASAGKQDQQDPTQQQQQPLQAVDQNQQEAQQAAVGVIKPEAGAQQAAEVSTEPPKQPSVGAEQQLPLAAQQLQAQLQELPEAVQQQVARLHRDFEQACDKFQRHKEQALAAVQQRQQVRTKEGAVHLRHISAHAVGRHLSVSPCFDCHILPGCCCCCACVLLLLLQEVRAVSELLPAPEGCMDGCFIGLGWLDNWVNSLEPPGPLDNTVLWCEHSRLNPSLPAGTTKYISDAAWQQLTVRQQLVGAGRCMAGCVQLYKSSRPKLLCSAGWEPLTCFSARVRIRGYTSSVHHWPISKACCTT